MEMLKTGKFAMITDDITARKVMAESLRSEGVCKFYMTPEPYCQYNQMMIFPVSFLSNNTVQIM